MNFGHNWSPELARQLAAQLVSLNLVLWTICTKRSPAFWNDFRYSWLRTVSVERFHYDCRIFPNKHACLNKYAPWLLTLPGHISETTEPSYFHWNQTKVRVCFLLLCQVHLFGEIWNITTKGQPTWEFTFPLHFNRSSFSVNSFILTSYIFHLDNACSKSVFLL